MNDSSLSTLVPPKYEFQSVWILTTQIKKMGPNITLWAHHGDGSGDSDTSDPPFLRHDLILGESRLGPSPMTIVENPRILPVEGMKVLPPYRFIRRLGDEDRGKLQGLAERESSLLSFVRERASSRGLSMQFVDAVGNFAANDFLLYYTAEGRIDFRELLKDIHGKFRGRVELRQISPREYTSVLDGIGACGKTLCCSSFLKSFKTISTRMAREAESEPNSMRSTGMCGRLKCCLSYEGSSSDSAQEEGGAEGGCSRKSPSKEPDWVPVTSWLDPSPSKVATEIPSGKGVVQGSRQTDLPSGRHNDNRYRKDSRSRG